MSVIFTGNPCLLFAQLIQQHLGFLLPYKMSLVTASCALLFFIFLLKLELCAAVQCAVAANAIS